MAVIIVGVAVIIVGVAVIMSTWAMIMRSDLLDPEMPDPVDGGFGETGQHFAVGRTPNCHRILVRGKAVVGFQGNLSEDSERNACSDDCDPKSPGKCWDHFPSR